MNAVSVMSDCQKELLNKAEGQGYLTYDDIMEAADTFELSVSQVDSLSELLQYKGIIIYETAPDDINKDELDDFSRIDYEALYSEIIELFPDSSLLVEYIKTLPAPQYGEVQNLTKLIANGNSYARERLMLLYARNVLKIALSMTKNRKIHFEDAVSAGFEGLITAIDRFDPNGFVSFLSYATIWITQFIQRECNPIWMDYYFPAHLKEKLIILYQMYLDNGCDDPESALLNNEFMWKVSDKLDISISEIDALLRDLFIQVNGKISWETFLENHELTTELENLLFPAYHEDPYEIVYRHELINIIKQNLNTLKKREQEILRMRFGLDNGIPKTLDEVAKYYNLTRERIRQIEARALRKMRHPILSKRLKGFYC